MQMGRAHSVDASNSLASPILCDALNVMFVLREPVWHCAYIMHRDRFKRHAMPEERCFLLLIERPVEIDLCELSKRGVEPRLVLQRRRPFVVPFGTPRQSCISCPRLWRTLNSLSRPSPSQPTTHARSI